MIPARHSPAFARLFGWYTRGLLWRRFAAVWARGTVPGGDAPLLVAVQHVAWWDPLVLFHLSRVRFPGTHHVMMDEANLERYPLFGRLGAFGVDRANPRGDPAAVRYALARLRAPGGRVWIFPQGRLWPADRRPIECARGADWLARKGAAPVVPVALRYEFMEAERPEVFASFGAPRALDGVGSVADALTGEADALRADVCARATGRFDLVLRGRGFRSVG